MQREHHRAAQGHDKRADWLSDEESASPGDEEKDVEKKEKEKRT